MAQTLTTSGEYRKTASFQTATTIYDATWWFCEKFLDPHSRMADQMLQAARSGRHNIAGAGRAPATTSSTAQRLLNVARSSLEKLLLDFEDFLRHRHLKQWDPESPEARNIREVHSKFRSDKAGQSDLGDDERWAFYKPWLEHDDAAVRANALISLINEAAFLLDRQITGVKKQFTEDDGNGEQPAESERTKKGDSSPTEKPTVTPNCPKCGKAMVMRQAKTGKNAGNQFWGCSNYPECKGVAKI